MKERYYGTIPSETGFEHMTEMHKDLVAIHGEMVLLKTYSSLNFAGREKLFSPLINFYAKYKY